jgi:hypothetical protein
MQFEHELIDRRLTWLLTSESLLFAAYGIALEKAPSFLQTVAVVGLLISGAVFVGVVASILAKIFTWCNYRRQTGKHKEELWVRTWVTIMGFVPDLTLPIVFAWAWRMVLARACQHSFEL